MKVLGLTFLYNPDINSIVDCISSYAPFLDKLVLWNNTPQISESEILNLFSGYKWKEKIEVSGLGKNVGLSIPLNSVYNMVLIGDYDGMVVMDQDSKWVNFDVYLDVIKKDDDLNCIYMPSWNGNNVVSNEVTLLTECFIINSGTYYSRQVLEKLGIFNEDFFVEGIDTEYGLRAESNGVWFKRINQAVMKHQVFDSIKVHKLLCVSIPECKYNNHRIYEIMYSIFYLIRSYSECRFRLIKYWLRLFGVRLIVSILFYSENKLVKLGFYFRGIRDGLLKIPLLKS